MGCISCCWIVFRWKSEDRPPPTRERHMGKWEWQKSKKNEDERYNGYIFLLSCFLLSFLIKIGVCTDTYLPTFFLGLPFGFKHEFLGSNLFTSKRIFSFSRCCNRVLKFSLFYNFKGKFGHSFSKKPALFHGFFIRLAHT